MMRMKVALDFVAVAFTLNDVVGCIQVGNT
jgi:hypothetical protein